MPAEKRPDPERLLARLAQENRGKLTVFLGPAAGVGKTYAMLEVAHEWKREGLDVVVAWVETHQRPETAALLTGLEQLPPVEREYRGRRLPEMDLDAVLARQPQLALVDELAHTNVPGSRHAKRYQDVEELLAAGINVFTTLNIQHVESVNDIVAKITGVKVKETVPDRILAQAHEIRLIDLSPEELRQRLREGKVYVPAEAEKASKNFFRPGNIQALRELALRYTAARVEDQLENYMADHAIAGPWPASEKAMVAISPNPFAAQLIRYGLRTAQRYKAEWLVVYVDQTGRGKLPPRLNESLSRNLHLAEELGAEVVTLTGNDIASELAQFARVRNVTQIIIGKPLRPRWRDFWRGSPVDRLLRQSPGISVHVIPTLPTGVGSPPPSFPSPEIRPRITWRRAYLQALDGIVALTVFTFFLRPVFRYEDLNLLYLLPVLSSAARFGLGPALFTTAAGIVAIDFFFTHPYFHLTVANPHQLLTLAIYLVVASLISSLAARLRNEAYVSRRREARTAALYHLSRAMAATSRLDTLLELLAKEIRDILHCEVVILLPNDQGELSIAHRTQAPPTPPSAAGDSAAAPEADAAASHWDEKERATAVWVFQHGEMAGFGTETLAGVPTLYLPLKSERRTVGVLGIRRQGPRRNLSADERRMLKTFAGLAALAVERVQLTTQAQAAEILRQSEQFRLSLLDSVSHDLRTPLSSILGAVTTLLEDEKLFSPEARRNLLETIREEAEHTNRLVGNLLDMSRLEAEALRLHRDWCDLQDLIGSALRRLDDRLKSRALQLEIPADLPLLYVDFVLIEQVIVNILDNAVKFSPPGTAITISAQKTETEVSVSIADRGPGIPPAEREKVFEKFYQARRPEQTGGVGLGLAICQAIIAAHNGTIRAEERPGGGTQIIFTLPLGEKEKALHARTQIGATKTSAGKMV